MSIPELKKVIPLVDDDNIPRARMESLCKSLK
jgi:hypothetical protein